MRIFPSYPKWLSVETGYNPEQLAATGIAKQLSSGFRTILGFKLIMLWLSTQSSNLCVASSGSDIEALCLDFGVILNTVPPCTDSLVHGPASAEVQYVSAFPPRVLCEQYKQPVNVLIRAKATTKKHTLLPLQLPDKFPATLAEETRDTNTRVTQHAHEVGVANLLQRWYLNKL